MLLVELPFVVGGWLRHLLPFLLTKLLVRDRPAGAGHGSRLEGRQGPPSIALRFLEALVAWHIGGPWLLAGFLAWLIPGGIWLLAWHGRCARVVRQALRAWRRAAKLAPAIHEGSIREGQAWATNTS